MTETDLIDRLMKARRTLDANAQLHADVDDALDAIEDAAKEIERLTAALRYEQHQLNRIGTHGVNCWKWGPQHYECARRKIEDLEGAALVYEQHLSQKKVRDGTVLDR